jgi:biotin carboxylase
MKRLLACLALVLITACSMIQPKSLDQTLAYGVTATATVLNTTSNLYERHRISKEEASSILATSEQIKMMIDSAHAAAKAGKSADANTQAQAALSMLQQLETYLKTKEAAQ